MSQKAIPWWRLDVRCLRPSMTCAKFGRLSRRSPGWVAALYAFRSGELPEDRDVVHGGSRVEERTEVIRSPARVDWEGFAP